MANLSDIVASPHQLNAKELRDVELYWTEDRIRSASPLPIPTLDGEPPVEDVIEVREPDVIEHSAVEPDAEVDDLSAETACFVTSLVSNRNVSPYKYVGKLYMTFGGNNYVGSAWCICKKSICTAGHCVHDKSTGWATNVIFKGRYNSGSQSGTWAIPTLAAPKGWTDNQDYAYDYAGGISNGNIQSVIGSAGYLINASPNQGQIDSIGYPASAIAGYNFDGQRMWHCDGKYLSGSTILKMCNNMTGGCSGGPWSVTYNGNHRMNGINSHRYTSDPNSLYSPYFGSGFKALTDWLSQNGGC